MKFERRLITPEIANQMLETNTKNRRIKTRIVIRYAQDMAAGRWKEETGEVLKISKTGNILDGQHRLLAVVKSKESIYFHVATNVDDDVFDVLDTGSNRSASDAFFIKSVKHENVIPSIISLYYMLKGGYSLKGEVKYNRPTNSVLLDEYYSKEQFWQMVANKSGAWYNAFAKILSPSFVGGMYAFFYHIDEQDAEKFMDQLATGQNITNRTVGQLRQRLMQDKMSPRKMTMTLKHALMLKAWNYFRNGEEKNFLSFNLAKDNWPIAI
jgi:hypothetical protein